MTASDIKAFIKQRAELLIISAVCLLAFCLRLYFLRTYPDPLTLREQDGIAYMSIAKDLLHFNLVATYQPPGYPAVIALFSFLPTDFEDAARLASITMDALTVFPLFWVARRTMPTTAAIAAAVIWAFFSFSLVFTPSPLSQSTYLLFLMLGTSFLYRGWEENGKSGWFLASGLCLGYSYLTRPEGIAGFAGAVLLSCLLALYDKIALKVAIARLGMLATTFLIVAAPYWIFLRRNLGYWTFTGKTEIAIKGIDGALTMRDGKLASSAGNGFSLFLEQYGGIGGAIATMYKNFMGFMTTLVTTFHPWMLVVAAVAVGYLCYKRKKENLLLFGVPMLATVPLYVANLPKTHSYIYPLFLLFLTLFALGGYCISGGVLHILGRFFRMKDAFRHAVVLVLLSAPIAIAAQSFLSVAHSTFCAPDYVEAADRSQHIFKEAARIISSNSGVDDSVMTRWGLVGYFASRPVVGLPNGSIPEVLAYGRNQGAKMLMIDTVSVFSRRKELTDLLSPLYGRPVNPAYGLQVIAAGSHDDLGGYVVYRLL